MEESTSRRSYLQSVPVASHLVSSDSLPEPPHVLISNSLNSNLYEFSVDTMVIHGNMVLWLCVEGLICPFDITDHYPILAGRDQHGNALFVAAVKLEFIYHFTCIEDGARIARYTDEIGDTHESDKFFVLALRHDPSDLTPPYPLIPGGAMDQTGPLYWLKFWPEKDLDYCAATNSAKADDGHLVSLLNTFDGKTDLHDAWMWG